MSIKPQVNENMINDTYSHLNALAQKSKSTIGKVLSDIASMRGILKEDQRIKENINSIDAVEKETGEIIVAEKFIEIV